MMISGPERWRLYRPLDLLVSVVGLTVSAPVLFVSWIAASRSAKASGLFRQVRIGQHGEPFEILKFRTMRADTQGTTVTAANDMRITRVGRFLRRSKLDEIPQLVNVVRGEMSLIGPRPDVSGFADELEGEDRILLKVRPGVTGPASVLFASEEVLLAAATDPDAFNAEVLYPLKTAINRAWVDHGTLLDDAQVLLWTVKRPSIERVEALISRWDSELEVSLNEVEEKLGI